MLKRRFALMTAASFLLSAGVALARSCTGVEEIGRYKNRFACPVNGGATVRPPDACAPKGGGSFQAGRAGNHFHNALDMNAPEKTAVLATKPGKVAIARANWQPTGMGSAVIIDHEDGDYSIYGHLDQVKVTEGACVKPGDVVGTVGFTGNASCLVEKGLGAHLHFAIIRAAAIGLADPDKLVRGEAPIAKAVKNGNDWLELGKEVFPGDILDLGIKDPEPILKNVAGCLR
ncbi:M23 family metallopeptidase [Methylobacterium sp. NEAU 140]|uniref:M23 family metallopeptidase n=1 Tax=Methylobacterium sp. NEAU 140 TaxID=3064945 RepID=UPI002736C71C|nr:M23 family metallopeptidase [Methylobacterium sp. NEAU 140]MDP4026446.1 M23 family metallopeptidase [Methylobacterium sp. NEAU 140]